MNNTGENEQGLRKIMDMSRLMSIALLILHFYFVLYAAFKQWGLTSTFTARLLLNISKTGLFHTFNKPKLLALLFLVLSLLGTKGKLEDKLSYKTAFVYIGMGISIYLLSQFVLEIHAAPTTLAISYMVVTAIGYLLFLTGGTLFSRIIQLKLSGDIFNELNESFPQEERLLGNEYSVNLPAQYYLKGKKRKSWINILNPFRGILVMGSPGSGKSYFVIQHIIRQHLEKGFSMFVYDFKFDDLTKITYHHFLQYQHRFTIKPRFYVLHFDDLSRSHRCNPLDVSLLQDITDAAECSRTLMLGLNRDWIQKQGDFFVESPLNFVTALIWFLCRYEGGKYCTLPHVIELAQVDYPKLFSILRTEAQIEVLINPFVSAYLNEAREQLEGQIASAKISLSKLASPQLYYPLSGSDFTLDINNPEAPKIVCMGNNPQKALTYGAVLSLYTTALTRLINKKEKMKCSLIFDEFPTIYFNGIDHLMATARSNQVATTIAVQDPSQLSLHYGEEQATVILSMVGNIISGQVTGESARQVSEYFGKIQQDRESLSINSRDTSVNKSKVLELAVPPSKVATLSSGEFVGLVADNPEQKVKLKTFHAEIINNHGALAKERAAYRELPVVRKLSQKDILDNYLRIKEDIKTLVEKEMERLMNTPKLTLLIVSK